MPQNDSCDSLTEAIDGLGKLWLTAVAFVTIGVIVLATGGLCLLVALPPYLVWRGIRGPRR